MKKSSRTIDFYDIRDTNDIDTLNLILNPCGIHFEKNLFDDLYVILDRKPAARARKPDQPEKKKTLRRKVKNTKYGTENYEPERSSS